MISEKHRKKLVQLGKKIEAIRLAKGLSQSDMCADIDGWYKSHVSEIESGKRNLSVTSLIKIADALGVQVKDLIDF